MISNRERSRIRNRNTGRLKWIGKALAVILPILLSWYVPEIRASLDHLFGWTKNQFAARPEFTTKRSTFGHEFSVLKTSVGRDSIAILHNGETTYQLVLSVYNMSDELLLIRDLSILDQNEEKILALKGIPLSGEKVEPEQHHLLKLESELINSLPESARTRLMRVISAGHIEVLISSNFRSYRHRINCVWFCIDSQYSIMGTDSTVSDFENNDPEGLRALGFLKGSPSVWPKFPNSF